MIRSDVSDFIPPGEYHLGDYVLSRLTASDAQSDYDALMNNRETIRTMLNVDWPSEDLSFKENLKDIVRHNDEFEKKESFTYGIWNKGRTTYLGCIYFYFEEKPWFTAPKDCDSVIEMWVVKEVIDERKFSQLLTDIKKWVLDEWNVLKNPHFVNETTGA